MEEKKLYTLLVYSENIAGILNQITAVFTRRQVNIESLNVSASSIEGVHKYTITAWSDADQIEKITRQIEKKIDVVKANYFTDDQLFIRESGLYKLSTENVLQNPEISRTVRRFDAHIIEVNPTYTIVMKHGITEDIYLYHCYETRYHRGYYCALPRPQCLWLCVAVHPFWSYCCDQRYAGTGQRIPRRTRKKVKQ